MAATLAVCACVAVLWVLPLTASAAQTRGPAITASPNPVPTADRAITTITWNAGPGSTAEVWVSINGGQEILFGGESSEGSKDADWIDAGSAYTFRVYQGSSHSKLLGSVEVQRATEPAFIRATPNPVPTDATGFNGKTRIEWNTGNGKPGMVYLSINAGPEVLVAVGARRAVDAQYVRLDSSADFVLYDESHRVRLAAVEVLPRVPKTRIAVLLTFGASLLLLIIGSCTRRDPAAFRRKLSPSLAMVMTAAALLPILSTEPRPTHLQPLPDAHEYADGARQIAGGKGYVTSVHDNDTWTDDGQARPPRYPPGFSLALVPFAANGAYPDNVLGAARWFATFYLIAAVWAAWSVGGPLAGMLAAGLIGISPFGEQSASVLLSEAFGVALTVLLVPLLHKPSDRRTAIAGVVAGLSVLVRFNLIVNIAALALATRGRTRHRALLYTVPPLAGLFLYQWLTFGSPLKTGYGYWSPERERFSMSHVIGWSERPPGAAFSDVMHGKVMRWACPCREGGSQLSLPSVVLYPAVLAGLFWVFSPPLVPIAGAIYLWRRRRDPPAAIAIWVIVLTFGIHVAYFYQTERFMAPSATLLTVFAGVALAKWSDATTRRDHRMRNARTSSATKSI
ncbi:MAG: hypothetical protein ABIP90_12920 [Vicinamibacterales bacterium]